MTKRYRRVIGWTYDNWKIIHTFDGCPVVVPDGDRHEVSVWCLGDYDIWTDGCQCPDNDKEPTIDD